MNEHTVGVYADREPAPEATTRSFRIVQREAELDSKATIRSFRIVQRVGAHDISRLIEHYSSTEFVCGR